MSSAATLTIVGNLVSDPELRFTGTGTPVVNLTIASTERTFDRATNTWKDGNAVFIRCSAWRQLAQHIAESLARGTRVIATGVLRQRSWETKEGTKRVSLELDIEEIGTSLRFVTATVTNDGRAGAPSQGGRAIADQDQASQSANQGAWGVPARAGTAAAPAGPPF